MNIWKSYMWIEEWRIKLGWSSQLYTQLLQLWKESLKKIQACTGFLVKGSNPVQAWIFFHAFFSQLQKLLR